MMLQENLHSLLNDASITALVSAYGAYEAIFFCHLVPKDLADSATSINYYYETEGMRGEYQHVAYLINCRALTEFAAITLQQAVFAVLHRKTSGNYYICEILEVIPPADESDNYNAPIRAIIKGR